MSPGVIDIMLEHDEKVVVTGGLGFIGGHLVETLLSLQKEVIIIDNLSTATRSPPHNAKFIQADLHRPQDIPRAMGEADLIFHAAANANGTLSVRDPRFDFEANAVGTFNVLDAVRESKCRSFVYVSSASVYGRPQRVPIDEEHPTKPFLPYGASKLSGEACCYAFQNTYGVPVKLARPFCVYGPGENPRLALVEVSRYLRWHLNGMPIQVVGDMDLKTRDFVHVDDVVKALLLVADRGEAGGVFNIGSGEEVSMRRLTEVIGEVTRRRPAVKEIPEITEDTLI
jgi:UDP-glucose 4-epimerase